jgi:hypothetical protein
MKFTEGNTPLTTAPRFEENVQCDLIRGQQHCDNHANTAQHSDFTAFQRLSTTSVLMNHSSHDVTPIKAPTDLGRLWFYSVPPRKNSEIMPRSEHDISLESYSSLMLTSDVRKSRYRKHRKIKHIPLVYIQTTELRGFSPQANYTDRATAACRRS